MQSFVKRSPVLASILVAAAGIVSLAQILSITIHRHRFGHIDDSLLPFTAAQNSRFFILSIGLLLLYLSIQIYRRKILAHQLVGVGLALLIGAELFQFKNIVQLAFYSLTLLLLILTRSQYTVATNNLSLRRGAAMAGMIILIVFVYATIGFSRLSAHEVGRALSAPEAVKYAAREVFTFQESQLPLRSRNARWFVASVNTAATVAYALVVFSLFRPLAFQYGASKHERELATRILELHSSSTEDFFKLWPADKHYYFSAAHDSFVAYKLVGNDAWILGGPTGQPESFEPLMRSFADFAARNGWSLAVVNASDWLEAVVGRGTYQRLFIGNEAVISVPVFTETTQRSKHFRYIRNRAERDGISFDYWTAPLSPSQIMQLRTVSNAWLHARGRREYTFALGYFDAEYIRSSDVAVLIRNDTVVAYANVIPSFIPDARTIDHMRYKSDMSPTGMHYLLMQLILRLHEQKVRSFNLGLAPLSGIEERPDTNLPERMLAAVKKLGANYYSFGGLEQFKNKFEPEWQPRYLYYQGSPARLLRLAASLSRAVNVPVSGRTRRSTILVLSVIAAVCYASFPLGALIDPDKTIAGLVSELGASGVQYAGIFNALDVISSTLLFIIIGLLWNRLSASNRRGRQILIFLGISALGNLLAAVTPLPRHIDSNVQLALHDIFSLINLGGIVVAAGIMFATAEQKVRLGVLWLLLTITIMLSGILEEHWIGGVAQRLQIVLTSVWFVIISTTLSRSMLRPTKHKKVRTA